MLLFSPGDLTAQCYLSQQGRRGILFSSTIKNARKDSTAMMGSLAKILTNVHVLMITAPKSIRFF